MTISSRTFSDWLRCFLGRAWMFSFLVFASQHAMAQLQDVAFNPDANGSIGVLLVQPDGKLLVAGAFTQIAGQPVQRVARLLVNGQLDATFTPIPINGEVFAIALQADGKLVLGGAFTEVGAVTRTRVARLNANGTLDTSFNPGGGANGSVRTIAIQADGRVLLGGAFTDIDGTLRNRIARLNANGTIDNLFNPGLGANAVVRALTLQVDGRVFVGGNFGTLQGVARSRIARLNADGSLDASFDPGTGATGVNSSVFSLALQPDGQIVLGGVFTNVDGVARNGIARLNASGVVDSSFDPGVGANGDVTAIALQADGRVLLGGNFTSIGGTLRNRVARINTNGVLDASFNPGTGANDVVLALAVQSDGRVLVGGDFTNFNAIARNRITRLNANGAQDNGFNAGTAANGEVTAIAVQADGRALLGGLFTSINGNALNRVARLNVSGTVDTNFDPGTGANDDVFAIAVQADGRILVGGGFTSFNGNTRSSLVRLNADGSFDTSFDAGLISNPIHGIAVQNDGRVLVSGTFNSIDNIDRNNIARLNTDGSLDSSFDPGTVAGIRVNTFAVQDDGRILVGGRFAARIARLNADGTLDGSFNISAQANNEITAIAVQADGRILLAGQFTLINGAARNRIARLNTDGTLDSSFNPGIGADGTVKAFAVQTDGRILLVGDFTEINGVTRNSIARLNANGSLDTSYTAGTPDGVSAVALQADGRALIGGNFLALNGSPSGRIDRLSTAQAALQNLFALANESTENLSLVNSDVRWLRSGSAPILALAPILAFSLTGSANSFVNLGPMTRITGGWQFAAAALPQGQNVFVRVQSATASGERNGSSGRVQATALLFVADTRNGFFANGFE